MDYVKFIYRPLTARAARQVLVGRNRAQQSPDRARFTRADADSLLKAAWLHYDEEVGKLPVEPTFGSRMNVRLACFTMSFFNALLAIDIERGYAIELVADAARRVYRLWSMVALGLAYLTPGRLRLSLLPWAAALISKLKCRYAFRSMLPATSSNPFMPSEVDFARHERVR